MPRIRLMRSGFGDECLSEWAIDRPETIPDAREKLRESLIPGRLAFRLRGPGDQEVIHDIDSVDFTLDQDVLLVPAVMGGGYICLTCGDGAAWRERCVNCREVEQRLDSYLRSEKGRAFVIAALAKTTQES